LACADLRPAGFSLAWKALAWLRTAHSGSNARGIRLSTRGRCSAAFGLPFSGREDGEESGSLAGLLQPGNRPEDFEGAENQKIFAFVIRAGHAQADPAGAPAPSDRKRLHYPLAVEVTAVLAPINFRRFEPFFSSVGLFMPK
jgi:hypothetical protein